MTRFAIPFLLCYIEYNKTNKAPPTTANKKGENKMTKTEIKKATKNRLLELGYKTIDQTFRILTKDRVAFVYALSENKKDTEIYEFYINYELNQASKQFISSVCIHELKWISVEYFDK